jgi:hypothetical protein
MTLLRWLDVVVLAIALPAFIAFDAPIAGYAVGGGAWLIGRAIHAVAERRARRALAAGNRRGAVGAMAAVTLGRVWLVALAVLLVGLAEREAGLAAAVLAAALFTAHLAGLGLSRLSERDSIEAPEGNHA